MNVTLFNLKNRSLAVLTESGTTKERSQKGGRKSSIAAARWTVIHVLNYFVRNPPYFLEDQISIQSYDTRNTGSDIALTLGDYYQVGCCSKEDGDPRPQLLRTKYILEDQSSFLSHDARRLSVLGITTKWVAFNTRLGKVCYLDLLISLATDGKRKLYGRKKK